MRYLAPILILVFALCAGCVVSEGDSPDSAAVRAYEAEAWEAAAKAWEARVAVHERYDTFGMQTREMREAMRAWERTALAYEAVAREYAARANAAAFEKYEEAARELVEAAAWRAVAEEWKMAAEEWENAVESWTDNPSWAACEAAGCETALEQADKVLGAYNEEGRARMDSLISVFPSLE